MRMACESNSSTAIPNVKLKLQVELAILETWHRRAAIQEMELPILETWHSLQLFS